MRNRTRCRLGQRTRVGSSPTVERRTYTTPGTVVPPPPVAFDRLLLETGDVLLLESGDDTLLEDAT